MAPHVLQWPSALPQSQPGLLTWLCMAQCSLVGSGTPIPAGAQLVLSYLLSQPLWHGGGMGSLLV